MATRASHRASRSRSGSRPAGSGARAVGGSTTTRSEPGADASLTVYEVGPRDGLQNEPETVATADKLELIARLARAGLRRIEATSFVSPKWIPQLADGGEVAGRLEAHPGVVYSALVPNPRGYERFRASGNLAVAAFFVSASETHNRRNVNGSVSEHLEALPPGG